MWPMGEEDPAEKVCPFCALSMVPRRTGSGALRCSLCDNKGWESVEKAARERRQAPPGRPRPTVPSSATPGRAHQVRTGWAPGVGPFVLLMNLVVLSFLAAFVGLRVEGKIPDQRLPFAAWAAGLLAAAWLTFGRAAMGAHRRARMEMASQPRLKGRFLLGGGWAAGSVLVLAATVAAVLASSNLSALGALAKELAGPLAPEGQGDGDGFLEDPPDQPTSTFPMATSQGLGTSTHQRPSPAEANQQLGATTAVFRESEANVVTWAFVSGVDQYQAFSRSSPYVLSATLPSHETMFRDPRAPVSARYLVTAVLGSGSISAERVNAGNVPGYSGVPAGVSADDPARPDEARIPALGVAGLLVAIAGLLLARQRL